jgi:hypothetical protein
MRTVCGRCCLTLLAGTKTPIRCSAQSTTKTAPLSVGIICATKLLERKATMQADLNAIAGALQQIDWTLAQLDEGEPEEVCEVSE